MLHIDITKPLKGVEQDMKLEVNLAIKEGEFVAISGVSGSGKTTLLRILAGLEEGKGTINMHQETWLSPQKSLAPQKRDIGFVFQDYALFDNMSVEENLLFVANDKDLASKLLEITNLTPLKNRSTINLSGGQKQRVSLCRAMMSRPKLLLMDEPLSALDPLMRKKLQNEIQTLHKAFKTTIIMISHDPSEIYHLASRLIVLDSGKVINDGLPKEILLKTNGSQKFSFEGEILDIIQIDIIFVAVVSIGQQIIEVIITKEEAMRLSIGESVRLGTKAFAPTIQSV